MIKATYGVNLRNTNKTDQNESRLQNWGNS